MVVNDTGEPVHSADHRTFVLRCPTCRKQTVCVDVLLIPPVMGEDDASDPSVEVQQVRCTCACELDDARRDDLTTDIATTFRQSESI